MARRHDAITSDDFDRLLTKILSEFIDQGGDLLSIPGVYEVVSEHFNNDVIDSWVDEQDGDQ